jgi:hypothetical protein
LTAHAILKIYYVAKELVQGISYISAIGNSPREAWSHSEELLQDLTRRALPSTSAQEPYNDNWYRSCFTPFAEESSSIGGHGKDKKQGNRLKLSI